MTNPTDFTANFENRTLEKLVELFTVASDAYYETDSPVMSDSAFDTLVDRIRSLDPKASVLDQVGAATQGQKIRHQIPMMSLFKENTREGLDKWTKSFWDTKSFGSGPDQLFTIQPKLDGSSIDLQYVDGDFKTAITRGDGIEGEDVTASIAKSGIPLFVKQWVGFGLVSVRGEAVLTHEDWLIVDPKQATNPRNVGNGLVRRQSDLSQAHLITFMAFDVAGNPALEQNEIMKLSQLEACGFSVADSVIVTLSDLWEQLNLMNDRRKTFNFDTDGAVIKPVDIALGKSLGISSGRPNGQRAYKWRSETANTDLLGITLSVGHTGLISPTLSLSPVFLGGVTVKSVLANNFDEVLRFDLSIGDTVEIIRAGELIPKLVSVYARSGGPKIQKPTCCPVCSGKVGHLENAGGKQSVNLFCLNPDCDAKATGKVKRWLKSLKILGIGDDLRENLVEAGLVTTIPDLYRLTPEALATIPMGQGQVGASRAKSIVQNINARRNLTLIEVLGSLGIPSLGKRKVQIIIENARVIGEDLTTLQQWVSEDLLPQIGAAIGIEATVRQITDWFANNSDLLTDLLTQIKIGEAPKELPKVAAKPVSQTTPDTVHTFLLTGKFDVPKKVIHALIEKAGHVFVEDWDKTVTHLVQSVPTSESSKSKKAKAAGIPVIGVDELQNIVGTYLD